MKREKDLGLQYLMELGIRPAKDMDGIYRQLREQLGQEQADKAKAELWDEPDVQRLYDLKNENYATSVAFSGAYDGDIYRQACNWIGQHKAQFGKEILDVGCDCGILSCFLAKILPESQITSIDRTANAIAVARQLAEKLQLTNITFLHSDIADLGDAVYDTVFSMRTVHENVVTKDIQPSYLLLLEQAQMYGNTIADYSARLAAKVKEGGTLVSIERGERNPMFLGWLLNLHENKLTIQRDSYAELHCTTVGKPAVLQALVAGKADAQNDNVYAFWCDLFDTDWSDYQYTGWAAETFLQNTVYGLEQPTDGYLLYNQDGAICGKYAIWPFKENPGAVLFYQGAAGQTTVGVYDAALLPEMGRQLAAMREACVRQGLFIQPLKE